MAEYIDEWSPSEVDKQQAKVRLVRLDAEGNPVDGSVQYLKVKNLKIIESETLDDSMLKKFELKPMSFTVNLVNPDPEFIKLLKGEDGDPVATDDSDSDPVAHG